MKATILTAVAIVFSITVMNAKNLSEKNSTTEFGTYEVSSTHAHHVRHDNDGVYTIRYEKYDAPVEVTIVNEKNCKLFLVRTNGFEVMYKCRGKYFGIAYMAEEYASIPAEDMYKKIDRTEYLHQRVLTDKQQSEYDMVRIIACFLPEVMS